jgi:hypothetical protein
MNRISMTLALISLAALGLANAVQAGTVSKNVNLAQGSKTRSVALAAVSGKTVFRVSITGPKKTTVTVDLRGAAGSVKYPGIFTSTTGDTRLRIYTYRPLEAGKYYLVLAKPNGPPATVKLQVTTSPAKPSKPSTSTSTTK